MFDSLVDFLKTNIDELNGHEVQISSEFKEHRNKDSKYIIKNWLFSSPEYRKWRITRLDGGKKLQVFNTVAYPSFDSEMPILGAPKIGISLSKLGYATVLNTCSFFPPSNLVIRHFLYSGDEKSQFLIIYFESLLRCSLNSLDICTS